MYKDKIVKLPLDILHHKYFKDYVIKEDIDTKILKLIWIIM